MSLVFCIGNGESRKDLDLSILPAHGEIYGTNALHRDWSDILNCLICCDKRMVEEALASATYTGPVYTRPKWEERIFENPRVQPLPDFTWKQKHKWQKHFHWGSGLHAAHLACKNDAQVLVMIGHDFYGVSGNMHNNIYKGTDNYLDNNVTAVDPIFWIRQFKILFNTFPDVKFIFLQPGDWQLPEIWTEENFEVQDLNDNAWI